MVAAVKRASRIKTTMEFESVQSVEEIMMSMFHGMWRNRCLAVFVGLNIPEILCTSAQPSLSVDDVAYEAGCHSSDQLYPIMRVLAQWGIGVEHPNRHFSKSQALELLRKDKGASLGHFISYLCSDEMWAAMQVLPEAVKKGRPAFQLEHGMTHTEYMYSTTTHHYDPAKVRTGCTKHVIGSDEKRKELAYMYSQAMKVHADLIMRNSAAAGRSLFEVYPWSKSSRVMDIGGSTGALLCSILKHPGCEQVQGILVDLPATIEKVNAVIQQHGVHDRIQLLAHDVFQPFPKLPEVDTIVVKSFFVMFDSDKSAQVLRHSRPLFPKSGGRFLVIEIFNHETHERNRRVDGNGVQPGFLNIHIHSIGNKMLTKAEWVAFLKTAASKSGGFKYSRTYETTPGDYCLFELVTI